jgi:hypothetical protein
LLALTLAALLLNLSTAPQPECLPAPVPLLLPIAVVRPRARPAVPQRPRTPAACAMRYAWHSGLPHLAQASGFLLLLWAAGLSRPWLLLAVLPLLPWLLAVSALLWPATGQRPACRCVRHILADLQTALLLALGLHLLLARAHSPLEWTAVLLAPRCPSPKPTASARVLEDGTYQVLLGERFAIRHKPVDEFDRRMFLLFLRDIHLVERPSKWPFVCQVWLAEWFGTLQELISRWEDYRAAGDWQRLISRRDGPLMPLEMQQTIIQLWARHLWWSVEQVTAHLGDLGLNVCPSRVEQVGRQSGLLLARRLLRERFQLGPDLLRPKDEWLVQRLFGLIETLQACLDASAHLTPQQTLDLADVQALRTEVGLGSGRELTKALPWGYRLVQVLCGEWQALDDDIVRCPHCGTDQVRRKSGKARLKR